MTESASPPIGGDRTTVLVHYYRAMVGRADIWRMRMDTTANWAIGATAAIVSFGLGNRETPHYVLVIAPLLTLAFLMLEIAVIKRLVLFLGHPLYAVALVLTIFLVFAGLGASTARHFAASAWAQRQRPVIGAAIVAIVLFAGSYLVFLPAVFAAFMPSAPPLKIAISLLLLAPLAFAMGLPFPLGLQRVTIGAPSLVPWAWGINGCASVVSAGLATLLAMAWGFTAVVVIAVCLYVLAGLVSSRLPQRASGQSQP